jgi:hypothetical protein
MNYMQDDCRFGDPVEEIIVQISRPRISQSDKVSDALIPSTHAVKESKFQLSMGEQSLSKQLYRAIKFPAPVYCIIFVKLLYWFKFMVISAHSP